MDRRPDLIRHRFEHWYTAGDSRNLPAIERSGEGYKLAQTQSDWTAWLAATADAAALIAENARLRGHFGAAVALLGECVGPLEVSAAVIEDEDGGEAIETLIGQVRKFCADAAALTHDNPATTSERRPFGCALAMRVLQSDLYRGLDDAERADCDELVQRNLDWCKGTDNPARSPE